jgi:hypothetical protein
MLLTKNDIQCSLDHGSDHEARHESTDHCDVEFAIVHLTTPSVWFRLRNESRS